MLDLQPATSLVTGVVAGIRDDQLSAPTPCAGETVGDLLDHLDGLSTAFVAAAAKSDPQGRAGADASRLDPDWRTRIPQRLAALADAWTDPDAWTGMTQAGGITLPGQVAGLVALDEVIVHGWDLAVASGQPFGCPDEQVEGAMTFVRGVVADNPDGRAGLFGPPVAVADDAPALDRLLGLTGRDPSWRPPTG